MSGAMREPQLGEVRKGHEIGKLGPSQSFQWHACLRCGRCRWVVLRRGEPNTVRCRGCSWRKDAPYFGACTVPGCDRPHKARGYCSTHYARWNRGTDLSKPIRKKAPNGEGKLNVLGYREVRAHGHPNSNPHTGMISEHRLVMSKMIGRALLPGETVHHKNGVRHDNRPENLELHAGAHGPGQRVEDVVEHATEMLRRYAPHLLVDGGQNGG